MTTPELKIENVNDCIGLGIYFANILIISKYQDSIN